MFDTRYAWLIGLFLWAAPANATLNITNDHGGVIDEYIKKFRSVDSVAITGACISACTIALSLPSERVCVSRSAVLGFHRAYYANVLTGAYVRDDPQYTALLWRSYPAGVRYRLGSLTRKLKWISGSDLIRLGVRECRY